MWLIINKIIHRSAVIVTMGSGLLRCEKSPLGPQINVPPLPSDVTPISVASSGSTTDSGRSGVVSATSVVCAAQPARQVFYTGSNIRLNFSCNKAVTDVTATDLPTFLTLTASGQTIAGAGSAPSTPGTYSWSFTPVTQDSNAIKTSVTMDVFNAQSLSTSLSPPSAFDSTNNQSTSNGVEFDLGHTVTLDSAWDGTMSDVSLKVSGVTTDLATVTLFASCSAATGDYICNGTGSNSGSTQDNHLKLKWRWGAFDQGLYTLKVTPQITIEGGITSLPQVQTTFQVPIQSTGNIILNNQGSVDDVGLDDYGFKLSLAISNASSGTNSVFGLLYPVFDFSRRAYFTRFQIDRTLSPANSAASLNQSATHINVTSGDAAKNFLVKSIPQGGWMSLGAKATGLNKQDILLYRISETNGNVSLNSSVQLTQYTGTSSNTVDVESTDSFAEGASTKVMIPFVRRSSGQYYLTLAKANIDGTDRTSVLDDTYFGVEAAGGYSVCELDQGAISFDRLKAHQILEGNSRYVYIAYRAGQDFKLVKALTSYSSGYGRTGPVTVDSGVFTQESWEVLDLALGNHEEKTTAGVVYATSANRCKFSRLDENLGIKSLIQIGVGGATDCYGPRIHYIPQTRRFLVIYAERDGNGKYDIKYVEVTPGVIDTISSPTIVVQDLDYLPLRIGSTYYEEGHWMAIVYRTESVNQLRFHGFHVSGF